MSKDLFNIKESGLLLKRNPDLPEVASVKAAMLTLLTDNPGGAQLDMSPVGGLNSTTVGMVVAIHLRAAEAGQRLAVRITGRQKRLFDLTMLTGTLPLEVVGEPDGG